MTKDELITLEESGELTEEQTLELASIRQAEQEVAEQLVEAERARLQDLRDRFEGLNDKAIVHSKLFPDVPNMELHFINTILKASAFDAEARMDAIEAEDASLFVASFTDRQLEERKKKYPSIEELVVAIIEGDNTELQRLKDLRESIKTEFPKS